MTPFAKECLTRVVGLGLDPDELAILFGTTETEVRQLFDALVHAPAPVEPLADDVYDDAEVYRPGVALV